MALFDRVVTEGREGTFELQVPGMPYGFSLDLSFNRKDKQPYDPEKGKTKGWLNGTLSYYGPSHGHHESPDDFLDDDESDDVLKAASKRAGAKLSWSAQSWSQSHGHWIRTVTSQPTVYAGHWRSR